MLDARHDLPLCRTVARQLISDHDARRPALALQKLAEQALGGALITPALDQHIEHDAVLIDRAPQPVLLAGDLHHNLILSANSPNLPKLPSRNYGNPPSIRETGFSGGRVSVVNERATPNSPTVSQLHPSAICLRPQAASAGSGWRSPGRTCAPIAARSHG